MTGSVLTWVMFLYDCILYRSIFANDRLFPTALSSYTYPLVLTMEWTPHRRTEADEGGQMWTRADEYGRLTNADRF